MASAADLRSSALSLDGTKEAPHFDRAAFKRGPNISRNCKELAFSVSTTGVYSWARSENRIGIACRSSAAAVVLVVATIPMAQVEGRQTRAATTRSSEPVALLTGSMQAQQHGQRSGT
jgi:hypothetical protein